MMSEAHSGENRLPLIPPVCPTCRVACLYEASTPEMGSGVVNVRHYCPTCGWNPEVDGCPVCGRTLVLDANDRYVHKRKARPWSRCDGMRLTGG